MVGKTLFYYIQPC